MLKANESLKDFSRIDWGKYRKNRALLSFFFLLSEDLTTDFEANVLVRLKPRIRSN